MKIPLGTFTCVTGVSGSGKSTLINETLYPILRQHFYKSRKKPLAYNSIKGIEHIDKVIEIDQSPIGRTPRSNPATYTGVFTDIRKIFFEPSRSEKSVVTNLAGFHSMSKVGDAKFAKERVGE